MGDLLLFDAGTHVYRLPDGRRVPSVTHILREVRVSEDFENPAWGNRLAIDFKRELGGAVHADAHAYDDDALDELGADGTPWPTVDRRLVPYLEAWITFRRNSRITPVTRERAVFHEHLFYCGTLDGIFERDGKRILVDLKTGDPVAAAAKFQTAAYKIAWESQHPDQPIDERWSVWLDPKLIVPYRVTEYPDHRMDATKWFNFVMTYREQAARRKDPR